MFVLGLEQPRENALQRTSNSRSKVCIKGLKKKKSVSSGIDKPWKQLAWGF